MINNFLLDLRNNPKLRWGVFLIIGITWFYGVLVLRESLQEQEQQHRAAMQSIPRLRALLAQPEWISRVIPAKTLAAQIEGKLWQAPTPGLAQAAFQDWINTSTAQAGIVHPQIIVNVIDEAANTTSNQSEDAGTAPLMPTDLLKITANIGFDFSAPALTSLLSLIENNDKQIIVTALNARKDPAPRIEIELSAYFQKQETSTQTGNKPKPNKELVPL